MASGTPKAAATDADHLVDEPGRAGEAWAGSSAPCRKTFLCLFSLLRCRVAAFTASQPRAKSRIKRPKARQWNSPG
eukprot:327659-Chlamydomonas_euryale.AAC.1